MISTLSKSLTLTVIIATMLTGCASLFQWWHGGSPVFHEISPPVVQDESDLNSLAEALAAQRGALSKGDPLIHFGDIAISRQHYLFALDQLIDVLRDEQSSTHKLEYIRRSFRFIEAGTKDGWGSVLVTGYFEPTIAGSLTPTSTFSQPLYGVPADLEHIEPGKLSLSEATLTRGRYEDGQLLPYYSRQEIDGQGVLRERQLELCWVDPIDAFFLHIQGSGRVRLPDGTMLHLVYGDKNGLPYEAIGRRLRDRIAPGQMTMQSIIRVLRTLSTGDRQAILFSNPSYIFFRISDKRSLTSIGTPAIPYRTIATDPAIIPKGALGLLIFEHPITNLPAHPMQTTTRLVVSQDTGSAITGPSRVDLFCGGDESAGSIAGGLQARGRIMYLLPRH